MRKQDFQFELPESLIANEPCQKRSESRLMVIDPSLQTIEGRRFYELVNELQPQDCLIFNNTKVIPARLQGQRESGGKVEVLIERVIPGESHDECVAQIRASNKPKPGIVISFHEDFELEILSKEGGFFRLKNLSGEPLMELIDTYGTMPLPPYIRRTVKDLDRQRYQTVYAEKRGAVAAPTAGLHFDHGLLKMIEEKEVAFDFVTLHVGAGTFSPIRVDKLSEHKMHSEWFEVPQSTVDLIAKTRANGGRVIAVGTTAVRCLESASQSGQLEACQGETDIFIYPGYEFKSVDALITNFHLSESSLLMLVSAFAGREFILKAYQTAIESEYRFFSYGDAMFIQNRI